jgi:hypothetical protein
VLGVLRPFALSSAAMVFVSSSGLRQRKCFEMAKKKTRPQFKERNTGGKFVFPSAVLVKGFDMDFFITNVVLFTPLAVRNSQKHHK